jgi:hypothetical protein
MQQSWSQYQGNQLGFSSNTTPQQGWSPNPNGNNQRFQVVSNQQGWNPQQCQQQQYQQQQNMASSNHNHNNSPKQPAFGGRPKLMRQSTIDRYMHVQSDSFDALVTSMERL